ncbi:MAG: Ni/Fe-hydrogenase cytochrome b subunit, partial [Bacteroidota bacterium]
LSIYLAFKIGDMFVRESFRYLTEVNTASVMFAIEIVVGVAIPLRMFLSEVVIRSRVWLFIASLLVIFGVLLNRINTFVVAYMPPYSVSAYFPSVGEISVTVGFISMIVLLYRLYVKNFPVISVPDGVPAMATKYSIRGGRS